VGNKFQRTDRSGSLIKEKRRTGCRAWASISRFLQRGFSYVFGFHIASSSRELTWRKPFFCVLSFQSMAEEWTRDAGLGQTARESKQYRRAVERTVPRRARSRRTSVSSFRFEFRVKDGETTPVSAPPAGLSHLHDSMRFLISKQRCQTRSATNSSLGIGVFKLPSAWTAEVAMALAPPGWSTVSFC
jgi:hypothetical protein